MKTSSTRRRGMAAFASTALGAGALVVPALLLATPAHAATSVAVTQAYNCTYSSYNVDFDAEFDINIDGDQLTVDVSAMPNFETVPASFEFSRMDATMSDFLVNGEAVEIASERLVYDPVLMGDAESLPIGQLAATLPEGTDVTSVQVGQLDLVMGVAAKPYMPVTMDGAVACTPTEDPVEVPIESPAEPETDAVFQCTTFDTTFDYPTNVALSAQRSGGDVVVTAQLDAMPGVVPVPLTDVPVDGTVDVTVDGAATQLTGSHTVASVPPSTPIPMPAVSGATPSTADSVNVVLEGAEFNASAMGMDVAIPCVLTEPVDLGAVEVEPETVVPPVVAAKTTTKVANAKYQKKKNRAVIKVKVAAGKKAAKGKVKITVKKGKKKLVAKNVKLNKKGVAKLVVKKGKLKKGKHKVVANYKGNKKFKKSKGKGAFKVKK